MPDKTTQKRFFILYNFKGKNTYFCLNLSFCMIFKKIYRIFVLPYTISLLYLMFLGFGREQHEANIVRLLPLVSTILFVQNITSWESIIINLFGNIIMFIPFGFLGWLNAKYFSFKKLIVDFLSDLIIVEDLQ